MDEVVGSPEAVLYGEMALMILALATDVLAVSLQFGLQGVTVRDRRQFQAAVTGLHVLLPILGFALGQELHGRFGQAVVPVGMIVFFSLGLHTMVKAWQHRNERRVLAGPALLLALAVSMDAFTAAVTLSFVGLLFWPLIPMLGLTAWLAAQVGFFLGNRAGVLWG
ncbi:MAG: manganese efflux pump, partial [Alicyclobacillaceae bacterium]|nr:manganese efflux pump [Alicyclobacillaceae bacterium]